MSQVSYRLRALHLCALWAYGVSQPVFSLLQGNPEFLVARGSSRAELVAFAALVALVPPLVALAAEFVVSRASRLAGDALHMVFVFVLLMPIASQLVSWLDPSSPDIAWLAVWSISLAATALYVFSNAAPLFLSASVLLPILGAVSFAVGASVATGHAAVTNVEITNRPAIVVVVFDEFPVSSLMRTDGAIDAARYPNFARLGKSATWYRDATTVDDYSTQAVPAILTGRMPRDGELPDLASHPENLFTLLGTTYDIRAHEFFELCPSDYCPRSLPEIPVRIAGLTADSASAYFHKVLPDALASGAPQVGTFRSFFDEAEALQTTGSEWGLFLSEIRRDQQPATLHFIHLPVPHAAWRYLPSGRQYGFLDLYGLATPYRWADRPWLVQQALQRHLLQVGYADSMLGKLLDRLERTGLYDETLLVVVADHGVAHRPGGHERPVDPANVGDIAAVPMFIKYPGQTQGDVVGRPSKTIDLLPTIADALGIRMPWSVDGESLVDLPAAPRGVVVLGKYGTVRASAQHVAELVRATVRRNSALFGEGRSSLYSIGTHRELLGAIVPRHARTSTTQIRIEGEERLRDVRLDRSIIPTHISGVVVKGRVAPNVELAIAVNGRIRALTRTFRDGSAQRFRALVPESALKDGHNRVDVFEIRESRRSPPRLVRLEP